MSGRLTWTAIIGSMTEETDQFVRVERTYCHVFLRVSHTFLLCSVLSVCTLLHLALMQTQNAGGAPAIWLGIAISLRLSIVYAQSRDRLFQTIKIRLIFIGLVLTSNLYTNSICVSQSLALRLARLLGRSLDANLITSAIYKDDARLHPLCERAAIGMYQIGGTESK